MSTFGETRWGLCVGAVINLVTLAVLEAFGPSARTWLAVFAAANEVLGVLLVASPELQPRLLELRARLVGRLKPVLVRARAAFRRLFGLPPITHQVHAKATLPIELAATATVTTAPPPNASVRELITFLLDTTQRHDDRLNTLERLVTSETGSIREELREMRAELGEDTKEAVRREAERNIRLRLLGLGYVVVGLLLAAAANIV